MLYFAYLFLLLSVTWGKKEVEKGRSSTTTPPPDDPLAQVNSSIKTTLGRPQKYLEQIFRNNLFKDRVVRLLFLSFTVLFEKFKFVTFNAPWA
jgi:hypothetical protein